jgi:hypothetical protein
MIADRASLLKMPRTSSKVKPRTSLRGTKQSLNFASQEDKILLIRYEPHNI